MIVWKWMSFGLMLGIRAARFGSQIFLSQGQRRDRSVCLGQTGLKNSPGVEEKKMADSAVSYASIATDEWDSLVSTFKSENHLIGKKHAVGIEGNNCRQRHRIQRAFRKTCCFSKKLFNHLKAFNLAFFYINFGVV
jgi:hypothetical protein